MSAPDQMLTVRVDDAQFKRLQELFSGRAGRLRQALRTSINAAARFAYRRIVWAVRRETTLTKSAIEGEHRWGGVQLVEAAHWALSAGVRVSGRRIPLIWFRVRQLAGRLVRVRYERRGKVIKYRLKTRSGGVSYKIYKGGRARKFAPAWIGRAVRGTAATAAEESSGHMAVFYRAKTVGRRTTRRLEGTGRSEFPVRQKLGPSLPFIARGTTYVKAALRLDIAAKLEEEIQKRIDREAAKQAAAGAT